MMCKLKQPCRSSINNESEQIKSINMFPKGIWWGKDILAKTHMTKTLIKIQN